ncbi:MAG: UDP-glucose 6-dehydrogenase 1 [Cirrosporium novae-zelandiae]|nr:MAG: UDP-glucose 6-dehydrogenase 1 [Cirrosporium novae-zelandiae]KAI9736027.1 MAG: UDP-glucose 6-dehydrogenase 1 [Cirrosporium novae-zelandiae]
MAGTTVAQTNHEQLIPPTPQQNIRLKNFQRPHRQLSIRTPLDENMGIENPWHLKKLACIGSGFAGGSTSAVIAFKTDIEVTVVDTDPEKIAAWNSNNLPIFESHLQEIISVARDGSLPTIPDSTRGRLYNEHLGPVTLTSNLILRAPNLKFSTDVDIAIAEADIIFICVNTPTKTSGTGKGKDLDLSFVEDAVRNIARVSKTNKIIVEKSTVPCKTAEHIRNILLESSHPTVQFEVLSNPEFLAEGEAVRSLIYPDRVIIGSMNTISGRQAAASLANLYAQWVPSNRIITMNVWSSELSKLAANAMLAQRVSSINALSAICEVGDGDIDKVARACGLDSRIGLKMLNAGPGFGGSCFQKDILCLIYLSETLHLYEVADYWRSIISLNDYQKDRLTKRIVSCLSGMLANKKIAALGFSFKKNTCDTRESPAIGIVGELLRKGAQICVFDPSVGAEQIVRDLEKYRGRAQGLGGELTVSQTAYDACQNAIAVVVLTEWSQFSNKISLSGPPEEGQIDWEHIAMLMQGPSALLGVYEVMENNNGQPGSAVAPQQQHPQLIKPEQIARLSNLNEDIRKQWINGLQNLWGNLQKHQKGSLEYEQLYRKLIEVSAGIKKNIESMAQRRTGAGQHGNGQQSATNGQHQGQQNNAQSHNPRALQIQEQAKRINVLVPPNILPTDRTKYIQTMRVQFAAQQVNQLTAQQKLKDITTLMNQRTSAGPPLSQEELANVQKNRDQYIKITSNCKAWLDQFQKQQEELRNQQSQQLNASAAPIPTSNDQKELTDATHQGPLPSSQPGQQNSNIPASNAAPATQNAGAANRIQGQEGMGTTNSPVVGTPTQASSQHVPVSQASNSLPAPPTSQPYSQPNSTHPIPPLSQHTFPQQHPTQSNNSPQSLQPHSAAYQGPPRPLSHQAAVAQANQFNVNQSQQSHQNYSQATPQQFHQPQRTPNETPSVNKMPVPKTLSIPTPQPVVMPTARPTLSGGPASSGSGMMGQPAIQKYPAFVLEGEGERVLSKKRLNELVRQVTGGGETLGSEGLSADVEETLLNVADEFVDQVVTSACKLAKLRQSSTLEIRDIQLILERNYNIRIPGYASDELRTVKKFTPAQGWTQKMSAVQASKVTGGKADL